MVKVKHQTERGKPKGHRGFFMAKNMKNNQTEMTKHQFSNKKD